MKSLKIMLFVGAIALHILVGVQIVSATEQMLAHLRFKALLSQSALAEGHLQTATKLQPCGTGMEVVNGLFSKTATDDKCIQDVFNITAVEKIPSTAMVPIWLGEKLSEESTKNTPWIRRFAIVLSTGASVIRQVLEDSIFKQFQSIFKTFEGHLFRPSSAMTLKYMKTSVFKMMYSEIIKSLVDTLSEPCALIPDIGVAVIATVNFQLSKWCAFGVTSILKRTLNFLITKANKLVEDTITDMNVPALKCFKIPVLVTLLTGRLDKTYAKLFNGSPDDLKAILIDDCLITVPNPPVKDPNKAPCCNKCQPASSMRFEGATMKAPKDQGLLKLVQTQMKPHLLKGEIVKYGLLNLLQSLTDSAFGGIKEMIKKFISWTNKFLGAAHSK